MGNLPLFALNEDVLAHPNTPEGVAWYYGTGCLGALHMGRTLTKDEYEHALHLVETQSVPTVEEVRRWLPGPFKELALLNLPCTLGTMRNYWRVTHRTSRETPVLVCTMKTPSTGRGHRCTVTNELGEEMFVLNLHCLELSTGDRVYVHAGVIAEKYDG